MEKAGVVDMHNAIHRIQPISKHVKLCFQASSFDSLTAETKL
jgi:hypothetical protein